MICRLVRLVLLTVALSGLLGLPQAALAAEPPPPTRPAAVTPGGSIAAIVGNNVVLLAPTGNKFRPITTDGTADAPYEFPAQSDDGRFIGAIRNFPLGASNREGWVYLWDRAGNLQPGFPAVPTQARQDSATGVTTAKGLWDLALSPDGEQLVWTNHWNCRVNTTVLPCSHVTGRMRTDANSWAFTPQLNRLDATFVANSQLIMACSRACGPGGATGFQYQGIHLLSSGSGQTSTKYFGDYLYRHPEHRAGKLAAIRSQNLNEFQTIEFWQVASPAPVQRCGWAGDLGELYDRPSWNPDGTAVVFEDRGRLFLQEVPDLAGSCTLPAFTFFANAVHPDWAPAPFELATTTTLTSSKNPAQHSDTITFTASVAPTGTWDATGTVTFKSGSSTIGTCTIAETANGACQLTTQLAAGTHQVTAHYGGDAEFEPSVSNPLSQTVVAKPATTTQLATSPNPSTTTQVVTLTATVSENAPGAPTGTVQFKDGGADLGSPVPLSNGQASMTTAQAFTAGTHVLTAVYSGDAAFSGSTSAPVNQTVNKAPTTTDLQVLPSPSVVGQEIELIARIRPEGSMPTGTVQFKNGTADLGTALNVPPNGVVRLKTSALPKGTHALSAVYSGNGWLLGSTSNVVNHTVNDAGPRRVKGDFDAVRGTDLVAFRPANGTWYIHGTTPLPFGASGDIPVEGDFNGDGKADEALFRPAKGTWHIVDRPAVAYGTTGDIPVPADYNGDRVTDIAVFRPAKGSWHIQGQTTVVYGVKNDVPIPGDYNGDGKDEIALYRPSTRTWHIQGQATVTYGAAQDVPIPADYNGDGKTDIAVYRPSTRTWHIQGQTTVAYGTADDVPIPGDYNGDGKTEIAVFRPSTRTWHIQGRNTVTHANSDDIILMARKLPAPLP